MGFQPGNNLGTGIKRPKLIYDAMCREVAQNPAKLKAAIAAQLDAAANGDLDALDWLTCRLEGKAAQAVTVSGDEDRPLVSLIRMVVVDANSNQINDLAIEGEIVESGERKKSEGIQAIEAPLPPTPLGAFPEMVPGGEIGTIPFATNSQNEVPRETVDILSKYDIPKFGE